MALSKKKEICNCKNLQCSKEDDYVKEKEEDSLETEKSSAPFYSPFSTSYLPEMWRKGIITEHRNLLC